MRGRRGLSRLRIATAMVLAGALGESAAQANTCLTPLGSIHPGWATSDAQESFASATAGAPVGRACTIEVYALVGAVNPVTPAGLVITVAGVEVAFDSSPPVREAVMRTCGCGNEEPMMCSVPYDRFLLTPREPLPASATIRVARRNWTTGLVQFTTTDSLGTENCEPHTGKPQPGHCAPPIQDCLADGGLGSGGATGSDGGAGSAGPPGRAGGSMGASSGCAVARRSSSRSMEQICALLVVSVAMLLLRATRRCNGDANRAPR